MPNYRYDQSIYGWRLADVRRLLQLAETDLPGLRRVDLVTNYRCPAPVVDRAVRLIEVNRERFAKRILARDGAAGWIALAPMGPDVLGRCLAVLTAWRARTSAATPPADGERWAVLARTNRELIPAVVAAVTLDQPIRGPDTALPIESPAVDRVLERARSIAGSDTPLLVAVGRARQSIVLECQPAAAGAGVAEDAGAGVAEDAVAADADMAAVLGWAARFDSFDQLQAAVLDHRERLARLRRDDAPLTLATAHGTKGLEFDHVAVIGMDADRFPSARSVAEADDPARALEEERRLAYVAWTRAKASLTLVYDPAAPSRFLEEAFDVAELWPGA